MGHINVEIKAKLNNPNKIRDILKSRNADFKGIDHQVDTYFNTKKGRLKLREGNIENYLIHYNREDKSGPKESEVTLFRNDYGKNNNKNRKNDDIGNNIDSSLKKVLTKALGILVVVDKKREIFFIDNVKFHIDIVKGLGSFVEIEVIDKENNMGRENLLEQCHFYLNLFKIQKGDLVSVSYSDLLLQK